MTAAVHEFTAGQRAAIVAEWQRIAAEPPPRNPRPYGCLTVIIALALLILLPKFGPRPPPPWGMVLVVVLGLALAAGLFVGVFVGSGIYGRASLRATEALDALVADPAPDDAARIRHAVGLVAYAVVSDGPTTAGTIDLAQAKQRLGANLDFVVAVERVLAAEIGAMYVFIDAGG